MVEQMDILGLGEIITKITNAIMQPCIQQDYLWTKNFLANFLLLEILAPQQIVLFALTIL